MNHILQIIVEAFVVGLLLIFIQVPITSAWMWASERNTDAIRRTLASVTAVSFLSGFLFHIIAEISGLNAYYVNIKRPL